MTEETSPPPPTMALFDTDGLPRAMWFQGMGSPDPKAVPITQAQYDEFLANPNALKWDGTKPVPYTPPAPPVSVPESISRRQFAEQLADQGDIDWSEAVPFANGSALPAKFAQAIAQVPTDQDPNAQKRIQLRILTRSAFDRNNPDTLLIGQLLQKDAAYLDLLWTKAAAL